MRISLKVDYALRAMAQLALDATEHPAKADHIAAAQDVPVRFLVGILNELKRARLVRSHRGADGGYELALSAAEISLADIIRAIDGPLANVHDTTITDLSYGGPAAPLREVWMALRTSLRDVLETVTLADLAAGTLPAEVRVLAERYQADVRH